MCFFMERGLYAAGPYRIESLWLFKTDAWVVRSGCRSQRIKILTHF